MKSDPILFERLLKLARRAPRDVVEPEVSEAFISRVLAARRRRLARVEEESMLRVWGRLTPWAAGAMAALALMSGWVAAPVGELGRDDAVGWERQIEEWVFVP